MLVLITFYKVAENFLNRSGLVKSSSYQFAISTTDTTQLSNSLTNHLYNFTDNNDLGDVVCVFAIGAYFRSMLYFINL